MREVYQKKKRDEAQAAQIYRNQHDIATTAGAVDVDLDNPDRGLSIKERLADLEEVVCGLTEEE